MPNFFYPVICSLTNCLSTIYDFGLTSFDDHVKNALMDIVELLYDKSSIIIAAKIPVKNWHETIGEGTFGEGTFS